MAYSLLKSPETDQYIAQQIKSELDWFEEHLRIPNRFNKTKSKGAYRRNTKGIAWFRNNDSEALERAYALSELIRCCGIDVQEIISDRIGYFVYEDDVQIIAEPFADTPT
ncbi:hypothetical protein [Yoonia sp. 2307UL14-13]|uniref:hypothetical protein n=1 Tax=Yoonia sp. 2307UL14-13 TaxID=3126506 RepID=UPI003095B963